VEGGPVQRDSFSVELVAESLRTDCKPKRLAALMLSNAVQRQGNDDDLLAYVRSRTTARDVIEEAAKLLREFGLEPVCRAGRRRIASSSRRREADAAACSAHPLRPLRRVPSPSHSSSSRA
jgi:hypothetical protein